MKLTAFVRVYSIPILLAILLFVDLAFFDPAPFRIYGSTVFLISVLILAVLTDKRYIRTFTISGGRLNIEYVNQFLQARTDEYELDSIKKMQLTKRRNLLLWPPQLYLTTDDQWREFSIISKELYDDISARLAVKLA
jgi:hypothetical protein